ncbi:hypothetical protein AAIH09_32430, partial [Pseudomonas aeruginosa]
MAGLHVYNTLRDDGSYQPPYGSVGRKKLILISRVMVLLCSWPSFWLLVNYPSPGMLLTVVFVMVSFTTLGGVPVMLLISELLPKRI